MKNIIFIKPKKQLGKIKLTVHKSGKLGFSKEAEKILNLQDNRFVKFGFDNDKSIFLKIQLTHDEECFKIAKAGEYFYILSPELLESFEIKKGETFTFDILEDKDKFFKLQKRHFK